MFVPRSEGPPLRVVCEYGLWFNFDKAENILKRAEKVENQHFLLHSQCFWKRLSLGLLKLGIVWWRVKRNAGISRQQYFWILHFLKLSLFTRFFYQRLSMKRWFNFLLYRYTFWRIKSRQLLKTLWEKEKLLVTSNFSFSHYIFYSIRYLYLHLFTLLTS